MEFYSYIVRPGYVDAGVKVFEDALKYREHEIAKLNSDLSDELDDIATWYSQQPSLDIRLALVVQGAQGEAI
jgi:hypothetical protein